MAQSTHLSYRAIFLATTLLFFIAVTTAAVSATTVLVDNLQPSWTAPGGGGVWAAYYAPDSATSPGESPGAVTVYDTRDAAIIKAGLTSSSDGHYWDEGLLGFKVNNVPLTSFASQALSFDVDPEIGSNPVWVRIRLTDASQTTYQFVPTTNPSGWHTVDAAAGQWQLMDENGNGVGSLMTLNEVASAQPGVSVDRVYLTLGMGDSYHATPSGTVAWVDKVTVGDVTYDFVVPQKWYVSTAGSDSNEGTLISPFLTIQKAVDSASFDDTINVAAGTYPESVLIDKPLTLVGAEKPVISGVGTNYIVKITASNVIFNNFEVNGGGSVESSNAFDYGIWLTGTDNVEISNSVVKNIWKVSGNGIQVDDSTNSKIHDNQISLFDKRGIRYVHSSGTFYNNQITGDDVDGTGRVQNLVNLWTGSNVDIYTNVLHNALTTPGSTPTWTSPGILVTSYSSGYADSGSSQANIHDNEIYDSDTGIIIGSYYAATDTSSAIITNNNFHNLDWAINFEKNTASITTLTNNKFSSVNRAVSAETSDGNLTSPPVVNAENNYWGTAYKPTIQSLVYSAVSFEPYYVNAAKTILSSPAPTTVYVDSTYTDGGAGSHIFGYDAFSKIQDGINAVTSGGTVNVVAGTYNENQILINKPLTVQGAGIGNSVIDGGDATLTTAGLVRITANGAVTFSGFTLRNAGGTTFSSDKDGLGVGIDGGDNKINIGIVSSGPSGATYTISNNKIIGTGNADDQEDYGLYANSENTGQESLVFTHNQITQTGANSILIEKHQGPTEVSYNDFDEGSYGTVAYFSMTYGGMDVSSLQKVSNNNINLGTGNHAANDYIGGGIVFRSSFIGGTGDGKYSDIQITGNTITNMLGYRKGIAMSNDATGDGSAGEISNFVITGNTVTGTNAAESVGVKLTGLMSNGNIQNNKLSNVEKGLVWNGLTTLVVQNNWWGSNDDLVVPTKITGNVNYSPFCMDSACLTTGTGIPPTLTVTGFTSDSVPMSGTVEAGYTLNTMNTAGSHLVQFKSGSAASENLKTETVGLNLQPTTGQTAALQTYYLTKPAEYRTYLDDAAAGTQPFAYIKTSGTTVQILDGAQYTLASVENDMVIPDNYPLGTYTVSGTIHDLAGNPATVTYILIVAGDRTPPTIDAVSDIVAEATSSSGADVTITPPMSHDAVDGDVASTCDRTTGTFGLGVVTVTCSKTDAAGNAATPSVFTVTVHDTIVPTIATHADVSGVEATSSSGAIVVYTPLPTASDVADPAPVVACDPISGSTFAIDNTTVTCTATDASGNHASSTFEVQVVDTASPTITINSPTSTVYPLASVSLSLTVVDIGAGVTSCTYSLDGANATAVPCGGEGTILSDLAEGAHSLVVSAHDAAGNVRTTAPLSFVVSLAGPAPFIADSENVTVDANSTNIVVPIGQNITSIAVPSTVADDQEVTLDLSLVATTNASNTEVTLSNDLTLSRDTTGIDYNVALPAGTVISGPVDWTGIINVPTTQLTSSVTPTAEGGKRNTVTSVVEVGFGDTKLTFDKAARLVIAGQAGQLVGYSRGGVFTKITNVCTDDTQATNDLLAAEGDCKIDVGSNLVIWTKHFTSFATYTQAPVTTTSSGGGGGGGGTMPKWDCGAWSTCSSAGVQTRTCTLPGSNTGTSTEKQSCTPAKTTGTTPIVPVQPTQPVQPVQQPVKPVTQAQPTQQPVASAPALTGLVTGDNASATPARSWWSAAGLIALVAIATIAVVLTIRARRKK